MVEIHISDWLGDPLSAIERAASTLGLTIFTNGPLKSLPGSRHWHLRKPPSSGTLEITLWPDKDLFRVTYHSNRAGNGWVRMAAEQIADDLARILGGKRGAAINRSN